MAILELCRLSKQFSTVSGPFEQIRSLFCASARQKTIHAVNNINLSVQEGEIIGLAGESGCGKSTLSRIISGLLPPTSGTVLFNDKPVMIPRRKKYKKATTRIQMVFQDPYSSLNQRHRVRDIISEGPLYHGFVRKVEADEYVSEKMVLAGVDPALRFRYPHQFSGGQRQRIAIARALAMLPDLLVCDEAVASLDVCVQTQILNLILELKEKYSLTCFFVSHDLSAIRYLSDRVLIMYLGQIVEQGTTDDIFLRANHPYTRALLNNMLSITDRHRNFVPIEGEISSPFSLSSGCKFYSRCPFAMQKCRQIMPALTEVASGHYSSCYLDSSQ